MNFPEILAPAGSYEAFLAAVHNGCDAVYLGGKAYGARAYAKNFDIDTLRRSVAYAEKFGVKIYYTINTLFKEKEVKGLLDHLTEVLHTGVDALIVQDIGMLNLLRMTFPEVELHASTQMNCHSLEGVQFLRDLGVSRVVLAREVNLKEIKYIKDNDPMELETFVHGALCYCYSGQCLMSSFLGGRSGNRGRCAQPCRLIYKGHIEGNVSDPSHVLSPKDIETLSILPDMIDAGVHSLKIEGRMKSPEYVGLMTALYRKYRDLYITEGSYKVAQEDINHMLQVFNRGEFSTGYYHQHNGPEMITMTQPKNQGRRIGRVTEIRNKQIKLQLKETLAPGDCLEFECEDGSYYSLIIQAGFKHNQFLKVEASIKHNSDVRRIKSIALSNSLKNKNDTVPSLKLSLTGKFRKNTMAELTVSSVNKTISVTGNMVQEALKQGMTEEKILKQLKKTGDYPVIIESIEIEMDDDIFMPVSQLNSLRRLALDTFLSIKEKKPLQVKTVEVLKKIKPKPSNVRNITVLLRKWHQFEIVLAYDVKRIYLEWANFTKDEVARIVCHPEVKDRGIEIWLALPHILRHEKQTVIDDLVASSPEAITGYLIRSLDGYGYVKNSCKAIQWDHSMNIMNQRSIEYLDLLEGTRGFMPSLELKYGELRGLDMITGEVMVYGHVKVMTSAQCVRKSLEGCTYNQGYLMSIEDRKGMEVPVETNCLLCYNNIYNGLPMYLVDKTDQFQMLGVSWYRIEFLNESGELMCKVLSAATSMTDNQPEAVLEAFTRGHFNKGVE